MPKRTAISYWLPIEDYLQTSHGLVIPADLIAAYRTMPQLPSLGVGSSTPAASPPHISCLHELPRQPREL